jgi:bifunctional DNA-binding transcriptional regulator/antitoxin component of YhaV-PrlF toxin-antitoxin module
MPSLLRRSLIKMGKGGLVVTVPKGWADYYGLKPGDEVQMIADGDLTISPLKKQEDGKAEASRPAGN